MTNELIIAIMFIPIVILSYGIGWYRGYKDSFKSLKELHKLWIKYREEGEADDH